MCEKTNSVCSFFIFPVNPSEIHPNYFDNPFCQRFLVSFPCDYIISLYYSIYPVYISITSLTRYQVKGSSSTCVDMLCVAIGIVGAILLIPSCVTVDIFIGDTLGGLPVFLCSSVSTGT